jgi:hypothetical protein
MTRQQDQRVSGYSPSVPRVGALPLKPSNKALPAGRGLFAFVERRISSRGRGEADLLLREAALTIAGGP